jgi:hypothetical protein
MLSTFAESRKAEHSRRRGIRTTISAVAALLAPFALLLLTAVSLSAQDWARQQLEKSPRHREWVTVKHGDRSVETFVVYP